MNAMSSEARASVVTGLVDSAVLKFISSRARQGATTDEIEDRLGMKHQTASPAVIRLRGRDLIARNGDKRPTRSGRRAEVYFLKRFA